MHAHIHLLCKYTYIYVYKYVKRGGGTRYRDPQIKRAAVPEMMMSMLLHACIHTYIYYVNTSEMMISILLHTCIHTYIHYANTCVCVCVCVCVTYVHVCIQVSTRSISRCQRLDAHVWSYVVYVRICSSTGPMPLAHVCVCVCTCTYVYIHLCRCTDTISTRQVHIPGLYRRS